MTENFDHWMNVLNNTLGRIAEALEKSCSDSHAPSNPSSHGPSAPGGVSPSSPPSSSSGPAGATGSSDSARRALADKANWPTWLTREAASTLPEGTERVYPSPVDGAVAAYPGDHYWSNGVWCPRGASLESGRDRTKVYHLPPAAKGEGDAWSRYADQFGYRKDMVSKAVLAGGAWIDGKQFNAFVAGECDRAVKIADQKMHRRAQRAEADLNAAKQKYSEVDAAVALWWRSFRGACDARDAAYKRLVRIADAIPEPFKVHPDPKDPQGMDDKIGEAAVASVLNLLAASPKPGAGRAEGVKCPKCGKDAGRWDPDGRMYCVHPSCYENGNVYVFTPAPKPSPGEVAEGIVHEIRLNTMATETTLRRAQAIIEAAIVRERTPHV